MNLVNKMATKTPQPRKPANHKDQHMKVFGSFFCPEMRSVCAILDLNEIPYTYDTINIFSKEGQFEYQGFNPSL